MPGLNDEIGPNNWSIDLEPWGTDQIIARMIAFGGLIRKASTGSAKGEANGAAEAEVQAKKRVCAESVMLGLFFYFLPKVWAKGEKVGKDFYFDTGEEQRAVYEMYRRAGLRVVQSPGMTIPRDDPPDRPAAAHGSAPPAIPTRQRTPLAAPAADRAANAAAALCSAERQAGVTPAGVGVSGRHASEQPSDADLASDKQLGLIAALISGMQAVPDAASAIDALGEPLGIQNLSSLRSKAALRSNAALLTRLHASKLIDRLKALGSPTTQAT
jgi:hypothetical protein